VSGRIIDTNVWVAASGKSSCSLECMERCIDFLNEFVASKEKLVWDEASFDTHNNPPGDSAYKELKDNLCPGDFAFDLFNNHIMNNFQFDLIELSYDEAGAVLEGGIVINQVESDGTVHPFEPDDRKWIALHLKHPEHPVIYNATDSDWHKARGDLQKNGIAVIEFMGED
jgi:hypothetical protein